MTNIMTGSYRVSAKDTEFIRIAAHATGQSEAEVAASALPVNGARIDALKEIIGLSGLSDEFLVVAQKELVRLSAISGELRKIIRGAAMTDTKFTPGPWIKELSSSIMGKLPDGTGLQVCSVGGTSFGGLLDDKTQAQRTEWAREAAEANAHLIAAAPELYAALVEARRELASINAEGGMGDYNEQLAEIEAVLAKARGEWSADDILKREG